MESIDKISLIITAYREPVELLEACLASAAAQTLRKHEYEIILVDNGSPDAPVVELTASFVAANDNARLCRLADNVGSALGRYEGVRAAGGDYVLFLDGDDVLARNALERLREAAFIHQAEIVFCRFERWNYKSKRLHERSVWNIEAVDFLERMRAFYRWDTSYTVCGRLFARSLLTEDILCPPRDVFWEDIYASVRINYKAKSAVEVPDTLCFYTWNPDSRTVTNMTTEMLDDLFWCLNENLELAIDTGLVGHVSHDILQGFAKGVESRAVNILGPGSLSNAAKLDLLAGTLLRHRPVPVPPPSPACVAAPTPVVVMSIVASTWVLPSPAVVFATVRVSPIS